MNISLCSHVKVKDDVLIRDLEGEAIILNLNTESYYGLDDVGTQMWKVLTASKTIEDAIATLTTIYDVDGDTLRTDTNVLIQKLVDLDMLELINA